MKVAEFLDQRQYQWRELETLCQTLERKSPRSVGAANLARFSALYRAACADLALADAYHLPPAAVEYLHNLVGRSHNQFYRIGGVDAARWMQLFFRDLPRMLFRDPYFRASCALFWCTFLIAMQSSINNTGFARTICGDAAVEMMEGMYSEKVNRGGVGNDLGMFGYYIGHNTGIGLQCFAYGLLGGVGGLFSIVYNALHLGAVFGFMATSPHAENFFEFVTAHGPCELTAIVLSGAAGMRLGFAMFNTEGMTRGAALRIAGEKSLPVMGLAALLFFVAAGIEGFISPSSIPPQAKAVVAMVTSGGIMAYLVFLGYPERKHAN